MENKGGHGGKRENAGKRRPNPRLSNLNMSRSSSAPPLKRGPKKSKKWGKTKEKKQRVTNEGNLVEHESTIAPTIPQKHCVDSSVRDSIMAIEEGAQHITSHGHHMDAANKPDDPLPED